MTKIDRNYENYLYPILKPTTENKETTQKTTDQC